MSTEYQKIATPFKRDPQTKKLMIGTFTDPSIDALQHSADWFFTEKVDGTNMRVLWDGHKLVYLGRTDRAEFSHDQVVAITRIFGGEDMETLFEQKFGATPAILYGELYGPKIQNGGNYRADIGFMLFDVRIDSLWLHQNDVEDIGIELGLEVAPVILSDSDLWDGVNTVQDGFKSVVAKSHSGKDIYAEGLVGTTYSGLLTRRGERVIVKIKHRDFFVG